MATTQICTTCENYSIIEHDGLADDTCVFCMDRRRVAVALAGTYRYAATEYQPEGLVDVYYHAIQSGPTHYTVTITDCNGTEQERTDAFGVLGTLGLMQAHKTN